jgi:hypothetical protein
LPQLGHAIPVIHLLLDDLGRVFPRLDRHVLEGLTDDCRVHDPESIVFFNILEVLIDQTMTFLGDLAKHSREPFHCLKIFFRDLGIAPVFLYGIHSCVPPCSLTCHHFHTASN